MNPEWADFLAEIERRRAASYDHATDLTGEGKDAERAFGKVDAYDEVLRLIGAITDQDAALRRERT